MSLIAPADQQRLQQELAALVRPVTLVFFTQTFGCETCLQAREILDLLRQESGFIAVFPQTGGGRLKQQIRHRRPVGTCPTGWVLFNGHCPLPTALLF